jgi:hypothetical protein
MHSKINMRPFNIFRSWTEIFAFLAIHRAKIKVIFNLITPRLNWIPTWSKSIVQCSGIRLVFYDWSVTKSKFLFETISFCVYQFVCGILNMQKFNPINFLYCFDRYNMWVPLLPYCWIMKRSHNRIHSHPNWKSIFCLKKWCVFVHHSTAFVYAEFYILVFE